MESTLTSQARKYRGFATERVVAQYLSTVWANANVGRGKGKDITGVPFDCEVKARKSFNPLATIRQYQARTAISGDLGFACLRLNGQGTNAEDYACIIRLGDLLPLLVLKYGHLDTEPTDADIDRCTGCGSYMIRKCFTCQPMTTDAQTVISVKKLATDGTIDQ
jgi:hypothetical protein